MTRPAIELRGVSKRYPLYSGPLQKAIGYLGFRPPGVPEKIALEDIDLTVAHGEKVGIIGRNGSGKTTLLKMVIGASVPNEGVVTTDGPIQAMMQGGYGFHDDLSGLQNVRNALAYTELNKEERAAAEADVVDFVELGSYIDHPVSTYSLGMRARLEFAIATAIKPSILAIDEVLGAGDGYFVRKSADRMRKIISGGTLLLVSHALDQIAGYCDRVIWIDNGRIRMDGPTQAVIHDYWQHMDQFTAETATDLRAQDEALEIDMHGRAVLLFPETSGGARIIGCTGDKERLFTGEPYSIRMHIQADGRQQLEPVLLGFSEHGALIFEAVGEAVEVEGTATLSLSHSQLEIGVGTYGLVPGLRREGKMAAIGEMTTPLRLLSTNWSDPPYVHIRGDWRNDVGKTIDARVSAWV